MKVLRILLVLLLGFLMVGFSLCATFSGFMMFTDRALSAWTGVVVAMVVLAVACFFGIRALLRGNSKEE